MEMMNDQEPPARGSIQAKDPFSKAPPGYSLTRVNSQWNWGKPPLDVDPEVVLDKAIRSLNKPSVKEEMLKLMLGGVSIEVMIEGYILQGFHDGRFTPDVGLLIKPPLAIVMANMAEEEGIPYRMFENRNAGQRNKMDDKKFFSLIKRNNPRMFEFIQENINEAIRAGDQPVEENFLNMQPQAKETEE